MRSRSFRSQSVLTLTNNHRVHPELNRFFFVTVVVHMPPKKRSKTDTERCWMCVRCDNAERNNRHYGSKPTNRGKNCIPLHDEQQTPMAHDWIEEHEGMNQQDLSNWQRTWTAFMADPEDPPYALWYPWVPRQEKNRRVWDQFDEMVHHVGSGGTPYRPPRDPPVHPPVPIPVHPPVQAYPSTRLEDRSEWNRQGDTEEEPIVID